MTAAAEANDNRTLEDAPVKDLYEIGEIPPLGHVPKNMYAWAIRRERHGAPEDAMQLEVVPTWELDSHEVLVLVMAAGCQLQRYLGRTGRAYKSLRRSWRAVSYRRIGCLRHRLGRW